jgi:glycosyltransferase involved in cell wall biosynthesis
MLLVFGVGMVFQSLSMGLNVIFQSHERLYFGSFNIVMMFLVQATLALILLWQGGRLISLAFAYAVAAGIALGTNTILLWRTIHPLSARFAGARTFAVQSVPVGLATLFQSVSSRIAVTFLTLLAVPYDAGIYAAAARIPQALNNIPVGIFSAVLPSFAAFPVASLRFKRLFRRSLGLMVLLSLPIAGCLFLFGRPVLLLVFGLDYAPAIPALLVLGWAVVPTFIGMAFSHVLLSRRELVGRLAWATGIALLVNTVLSLILIPLLSSVGAAWALLAAETTLAIAYAVAARPFLNAPIVDEPPIEREGRPRIGLVVQRYGEDVIGGAEALARQVALRLSRRYAVEVLSSCARDYRNWDNHYPEGASWDGPVLVRRFPVAWHRHWRLFGRISGFLFALKRNLFLPAWIERLWVCFQGPNVPDLAGYLSRAGREYEAVLFFTYLYYPTVFGLPRALDRAILVPTAHDEPAAQFSVYRKLFLQPRCIVFMTDRERDFVHQEFSNRQVPSVVAGYGVEPMDNVPAPGGYLLYIGRIEVGKNVSELFEYCRNLDIKLKVAGPSQIPVPRPAEYLGVVDEEAKRELLDGCLAVAIPSRQESLSILALEAWAHGKPVIARRGGVVAGLVEESGGGYCYQNLDDFRRILETLDPARGLQGREYVRKRFSWDAVLERFEEAIAMVRSPGGSTRTG